MSPDGGTATKYSVIPVTAKHNLRQAVVTNPHTEYLPLHPQTSKFLEWGKSPSIRMILPGFQTRVMYLACGRHQVARRLCFDSQSADGDYI